MSKLMLCLGTCASIATPLVAVISCAETEEKITTLHNQLKNYVNSGGKIKSGKSVPVNRGFIVMNVHLILNRDGKTERKIISGTLGEMIDKKDDETFANLVSGLELHLESSERK